MDTVAEELSVVITGVNCSEDLRALLESLKKQIVKPKEVIYIDAGSRNGTPKVAENFGCKVIIEPTATTPASGRNIGIRMAKGKYVLFLDSDCILNDKEFLKKYYLYMLRSSGNVAGIGSGYRYLNGNGTLTQIFIKALSFTLVNGGSPQFKLDTKIRSVNRLPGGNSCYKRDILLMLGGFNEKMRYCEEEEIGRRITKNGYKLLYIPELLVYHKSFNSSKEILKKFFKYGFGRAYYGFLNKTFGKNQLILLAAILMLIACLIAQKWEVLFIAFVIYLASLIVNIILEPSETFKIYQVMVIPFAGMLIHVAYSLGLIIGIFKAIFIILQRNNDARVI